jgi:hypothetical protein
MKADLLYLIGEGANEDYLKFILDSQFFRPDLPSGREELSA